MPGPRPARLVEAALRCYPQRWRSRHGDEAAELAGLLMRDGMPVRSIAWSYVDGRRLREPYLPSRDPLGSPIPAASRAAPYRVPPGEFYVMGDNRQISCDSRSWGPVNGSSIVGKAVLLFWRNGHPDVHFF
jgi:hypothetical protein